MGKGILKVYDARDITDAAWALSDEEGSGWWIAYRRTSCREGVSWAGKLLHSYEDDLQSMGVVDEDQARGAWPVDYSQSRRR
jgi:hypothetical protein